MSDADGFAAFAAAATIAGRWSSNNSDGGDGDNIGDGGYEAAAKF